MGIYILKFSTCLLLFIWFYKIFLERESFHKFKRFYLLGALFLASCIPLITFTIYVEPSIPGESISDINNSLIVSETVENTSWKDKLPLIFWSLYTIGVVLFAFRFFKHLHQLYNKITTNINLRDNYFTNVLLLDRISPHTFFKFIFLNKYEFENNLIPKEVLIHEQTHAKQLHALDILIVEIIHIILWFNPLIYIIKKDIKLNHEFLADQSVLEGGIKPSVYQELLLAFSSNVAESKLANAINYSLIKKRFTVMKTQTSKTAAWFKSMALLPFLAFMVYGFSSTKEIITTSESINSEGSELTARSIVINILENDTYLIDGIEATKKSMVEIINTMHQDITPEIRNRIMNIHLSSLNPISNQEVWFIYNALEDYGFHRIVSDKQEVVKSKGNTPFKENDLESAIENSKKNKSKASNISALTPIELAATQNGASREQMREYNELAKYYNSMPEDKMKIKLKDVERMKYIYNLMSEKQRQDAEPFPKIPKAPPAPDASPAEQPDLPPPPTPLPDNASLEAQMKYEKEVKAYKEKALKAEKKAYKMREKEKEKSKKAEKEKAKKAKKDKKNELVIAQENELKEQAVLAEVQKKEKIRRLKEQELVLAAQKAEIAELKERHASERETAIAELKEAQIAERVRIAEKRNAIIAERKLSREEAAKTKRAEIREARLAERVNRAEERRTQEELRRAELAEAREVQSKQSNKAHIKLMIEKDAVFYYEGKKISSNKALDIITENPKLNVQTRIDHNSSSPKVYISKKPIKIKADD